MKKGSTFLLKGAVCIIGAIVLTLCIIMAVQIVIELAGPSPWTAPSLYPFAVIMYSTAIPFFIALYQGFKMLIYIDKNNAFSNLSIKALKNIKYCALTISILYIANLPFLYQIAQREDAPGVMLLGLIMIFAFLVVATFSAVLEKVLHSAIDIKLENDLTV